LEQDKIPTMRQLTRKRLTKDKDTVMIVVRANGLICIPKGTLLPSSVLQPLTQGIFRVSDGVAYVLNKHTRREHPFGFVEWETDSDGQEFITVRIPISVNET